MSASKTIVMERDFAAGVYLSEAQSPIPLRPYTMYTGIQVYLFTLGRGGGRVEPERRLEGQQFTYLGRKCQHN